MTRHAAGDGRVDTRQQVKNVGTSYLALLVGFASVLVLTPLLVRGLGDVRFGLWIVVTSVVGHLGLLDLGLRPSVVKYVAEHRARGEADELREYVSTVFVVYLAGGALAMLAAVALGSVAGPLFDLPPDLGDTAFAVFVVGGAGVAVAFLNGLAGGIIEGHQRYDWNNGIAMACQVVTFVGTIVLLQVGAGLVELVLLQVGASALGTIARMTVVRTRLGVHIAPRAFRRRALRKGLGYATWAFVLSIATQIVFQADSLIISLALSVALVTVYSIAWRMVEAVNRVVFQTVNVCLPLFSDLDARDQVERQREVFVESLRIALAVAIPCHVTFLLLGDRIIELWIGPGYATSYHVLVVLSLTFVVHVPAHVAGVYMLGTGGHRPLAMVSIFAAVLNVILSVVLGLWLGVVGVALATGVTFVGTIGVIVPVQALRRLGLAGRTYLRTLAGPLGVGAAVWATGFALRSSLPERATLGLLALSTAAIFVVFFAGLITIGMSSADRARYVRGFRRARHRSENACGSA